MSGLVVGLVGGLIVGLAVGLIDNAWGAHLLVTMQEAVAGRLPPPWRMMTFLEDMARVGLLRRVGPAYQFRHANFQDHLTRTTGRREPAGTR